MVNNLERGNYCNQTTNKRNHDKFETDINQLTNISHIIGLSLPSLLLFTGVVSSEVAVIIAVQLVPSIGRDSHVANFNQKLLDARQIDSSKEIQGVDDI